MDRLPRELLDIITDELRTDVPSLRACALSLRDIVPSVQTHLFFKVVLHQPESRTKKNSQCQKFSRLLESSPHLASLVKDFRIIDDEPRFPLAEWRTLSGMLRLFDLKRISIRCTAACLDWDRLHRDFKASLQGVFTSPRLEAIQLHGILISAPPESVLFHIFMGSHANLQHLSVSCQIRKPDHRSRSVPPVWEPKLRSLVVGATHTLDLSHGLFSSTMDGSRLRTLTLSSFKNSEINEFLIAITPRNVLEDLNIHYLDSIEHNDAGLDGLKLLTNLRTMRFRVYCMYHQQTLAPLVNYCATITALEKIVLEVVVRNAVSYPKSDWTALAVAAKDSNKPVEVFLGEFSKGPRSHEDYFRYCFEHAEEGLAIPMSGLTLKRSLAYVPFAEIYDSW